MHSSVPGRHHTQTQLLPVLRQFVFSRHRCDRRHASTICAPASAAVPCKVAAHLDQVVCRNDLKVAGHCLRLLVLLHPHPVGLPLPRLHLAANGQLQPQSWWAPFAWFAGCLVLLLRLLLYVLRRMLLLWLLLLLLLLCIMLLLLLLLCFLLLQVLLGLWQGLDTCAGVCSIGTGRTRQGCSCGCKTRCIAPRTAQAHKLSQDARPVALALLTGVCDMLSKRAVSLSMTLLCIIHGHQQQPLSARGCELVLEVQP